MVALEKGVQEGLIEIVDCDGTARKFGTWGQTPRSSRHGILTVHDETFWVRLYFSYDVGCLYLIFSTLVTRPYRAL